MDYKCELMEEIGDPGGLKETVFGKYSGKVLLAVLKIGLDLIWF